MIQYRSRVDITAKQCSQQLVSSGNFLVLDTELNCTYASFFVCLNVEITIRIGTPLIPLCVVDESKTMFPSYFWAATCSTITQWPSYAKMQSTMTPLRSFPNRVKYENHHAMLHCRLCSRCDLTISSNSEPCYPWLTSSDLEGEKCLITTRDPIMEPRRRDLQDTKGLRTQF